MTNKIKTLIALVLAFAMTVSVLSIGTSDEVQAATKSFKGKGKSTVTLKGNKTGAVQYIKFKAGVTGTITLTFSDKDTSKAGKLQIFNSKKKPLAPLEYWSVMGGGYYSKTHEKTYGVVKGKTYYFAVQTDDDIQIKSSVKTIKRYNGTSKKKAKNIQTRKTVTGVMFVGEKKSHWYKFYSSGYNHELSCSVKTNGLPLATYATYNSMFRFSFYDAKGKRLANNPLYLLTEKNYYYYFKNLYIPKGTFYLKVEPCTNTTSGQYSFILY